MTAGTAIAGLSVHTHAVGGALALRLPGGGQVGSNSQPPPVYLVRAGRGVGARGRSAAPLDLLRKFS